MGSSHQPEVQTASLHQADLREQLHSEIERSGYYPALVGTCVDLAVATEAVRAYFVQLETTFDQDEVRRHVTVLVLTPTRLIVAHTDDNGEGPPQEGQEPHEALATTSTETVPLSKVNAVVVSTMVTDPASFNPEQSPLEVTLTVGWGTVSRLDAGPVDCGDPDCDADHGFTGMISPEDLMVRVSADADGGQAVSRVAAFAQALSLAVAGVSPAATQGAVT